MGNTLVGSVTEACRRQEWDKTPKFEDRDLENEIKLLENISAVYIENFNNKNIRKMIADYTGVSIYYNSCEIFYACVVKYLPKIYERNKLLAELYHYNIYADSMEDRASTAIDISRLKSKKLSTFTNVKFPVEFGCHSRWYYNDLIKLILPKGRLDGNVEDFEHLLDKLDVLVDGYIKENEKSSSPRRVGHEVGFPKRSLIIHYSDIKDEKLKSIFLKGTTAGRPFGELPKKFFQFPDYHSYCKKCGGKIIYKNGEMNTVCPVCRIFITII